ncbi:chitobiase/beta-hexosaminidase C-terminal domain-containing protein [Paenibacillus eucommiae]|uniref:Fibronectin type-III domain-containing protein n=1 Tax=Paenibacillus eucommiae TaxID=1355755 RepID=A0ABS4J7Y4_9BACL|nr:chitobiase/beta-hexosaminidase C-terminal domain-containing protein [Paenibacillus eucommiae]MBP1995959.1 hypothetical protein [Paenibacillus eucommiae]
MDSNYGEESIPNKEMIRDARKMAIPQYWNPNKGEDGGFEPVIGSGGAYNMQTTIMVADEPFRGNSTMTKKFAKVMTGFVISNDGDQDLTFVINGQEWLVYAGAVFSENFLPFTTVTINTIVPFQAYGKFSLGSTIVPPPPVDTEAPEDVKNLVTSNITTTTLTLTWTVSVSEDTVGYDVYQGATLLGSVTGTTYNVTGLIHSTQYTFIIKAKDAANNISAGTSVTAITVEVPSVIPPIPITNLVAGTSTYNSIPVSWTASNGVRYEVAYSTNGTNFTVASDMVTADNYLVTGLSAITTYTIRVVAIGSDGERSSGNPTVQATTVTAPDVTLPIITAAPNGGTFTSAQSVTLNANEPDTIYYTTDGSMPTTSSSVYSAPIAISTTATLKYFGKDTAGNSSTVQTASFTINSGQPGMTTVTNGLLHSYDFRGGKGHTGSAQDSVGNMPLTLTNFKSDGTEGYIAGGIKQAGTSNDITSSGYLISTDLSNMGMTTPGSSFTVVIKAYLNAINYSTHFFTSSKDNKDLQIDPTPANTVGRFRICSSSVGATKVHPKVEIRDNATTTTTIIRDGAAFADSTLTPGGPGSVMQVTYDSVTKTMALYLNGVMNKSMVLENHAKFEGLVLSSGQHVTNALLIYNRALTSPELAQVSTDLLALP